ncbi:hypothetical protein CLU79DRAFT_723591 [Phycomyces nitens]|nr:hypothetical protein CLU79DRAFT_723591 [Phycomyces nitens]
MATSSTTLVDLFKTLQFAWFIGHILTLFGALFYVLSLIVFHSSFFAYALAYAGAFMSYGVVLYKAHGSPKLTADYGRRLLTDENTQYLLLSLFWLSQPPMAVTLIPFATFSAFHALGYLRTTLLPVLLAEQKQKQPQAASGSQTSVEPWQVKTQQQIKTWTDVNYGPAMRFVAQVEVVGVMGRLLLGVFSLRFLPIFFFAQFLRSRYHLSSYTRLAFGDLATNLNRVLLPPTASSHVPPLVSKVYTNVRDMLTRFATTPGEETSENLTE